MGRDGIHQHARWIGRLATGHIDAHAVQRRDLLAQQRAIFVAVAPAFAVGFLLRFVIASTRRAADSNASRSATGRLSKAFQLGLGQLQCSHGISAQAVSGRCTPARRHRHALHIGQDVGHALLDGCIRVCRPMQAFSKIMLKLGISG
ncbi:hypothetical protein J4714_13745 [Staphylococcus epidermidis]|nr:hypothetical protein [Staphylococcus epidermidis]